MTYILTRDIPPYKQGQEFDDFFAEQLNQQEPGACVLKGELKAKPVDKPTPKAEPVPTKEFKKK